MERATAFYRDTLGLKFLFSFPGMALLDDSEGNTLALMSEVPKDAAPAAAR